MQSPVAILQKQRQYRASSLSQNHPNYQQQLGTSAGTPSSLTSSFIDHAFDHPTPTSFSQLQFLSSSVASNDGSDYTHRVPKVEERFCSGFNCCGLDLDDLHHLLEHFEECHVLPGGQVTGNPTSIPEGSSVAAAAAAAARMAANGADGSISSAASSTHTSPVLSSAGIGTSASSATSPSSGGSGGSVIAGSRRGSKQDEPKLSSAIAEGAERQMSNEDMMEEDNEDEGHHDMPQFDDFDEEHTADAATMALLAGGSANLTANSLASGTNLAALAPPGQQTAGIAAGMSTAGSGPMLSAPPSPAMSSASDHHITAGNGSSGSLYELGSKRRTFSNVNNAASNLPSSTSASTFPNFSRRQAPSIHSRSSRSPPSGAADDAVSLTSDTDDGASTATHLPFSRKMRQQSVDSLASVSTQGSTSSKKRSYNAAIGAPATTSSTGTGIAPAQLTKTNSRLSFSGLDMNTFRGMTHARSTSGLSTPDSSVPGTPASEYDAYGNEESVLGTGTGCLPPSLLYPLNRASPEDMTTDEEGADGEEDDDDDDDDLQAFLGYGNGGRSFTTNESGMDEDIDVEQYSQQLQLQQQIGGSGSSGSDGAQPNAAKNFSAFYSHQPMQPYNMSALSSTPTASMPEPDNKKKRMSSTPNLSAGMPSKPPKKSAGGGSNKKKAQQQAGNAYDSNADNAAAAMFLPLSLLSGPSGGNIPVGQASTSSGSSGSNGSGQASGADAAANIAVPVVTDSTSPNSQATASAATLAAIQAAAASAAFPDASTPTGRIWVPNNAKPFKCPIPGCDKAYKQQNGLKYHRLHGHCNSNAVGKEGEEEVKEEDKPFGCYVGPACGKKYKNMNGLRYHYQHSGAHGQIGLQMLSNGTHPPPAYPPGHKRSNMKHNGAYSTEFSSNPASTVVMNQSTAEALLAAISNAAVSGNVMPGINNLPGNPVPHGNSAAARASRPATPGMNTPNAVSRNASPMNPAVRISQKEREAQQMAQQHQREIEEFDASWDQ